MILKGKYFLHFVLVWQFLAVNKCYSQGSWQDLVFYNLSPNATIGSDTVILQQVVCKQLTGEICQTSGIIK